jgi:predicted O-methyltransferase YrrM
MNYQDIKDYAEKYAVPIMRTETSKLIADFVKENKPQNILEIGTAIGYSGLVMLENSDAELITIEHNKDYIIQAKKNFKSRNLTKRVKIIDGDCLVVLANMICDEKFKNHFKKAKSPKSTWISDSYLLYCIIF